MKIKNLKIGTQLMLGFTAMLGFVVVLGVVSFWQSSQIFQQTETIYSHPLKVRSAIGRLSTDLIGIRINMKDLMLSADEKEITFNLNQIETRKADVFEQIDTLYASYLGPRADIDSVKKAFIIWNSTREETIRLLRAGKTIEAANRTKNDGIGGLRAESTLEALQKIDRFAKNKAQSLYASSIEMKDVLNRQLILLIVAILILSIVINYILLRNIRQPIKELTDITRQFHEGDMNVRSTYESGNEVGILSGSFNILAEHVQLKADLDQKVTSLSSLMVSEYDMKNFFQATLTALASHTGSQMAAIYLLSQDRKSFDHLESIGVNENARQSFAANHFEGEFGAALLSRKVQYLKNIPEDTRFIFHTISGKFIPREIITIPILEDNDVVAVISLASVSKYSESAIQLIDRILVTLCARVEGIMSFQKIKEFLKQLEIQNKELEAQKTELSAQSAELTEQNTELEMQKNQLDQANQMKSTFLSNMSHELRTPLNSVIALSGVLNRRLKNQIPGDEYSYLEVIERNGKHLLALINDILDISRIEAGFEEIEITSFNACHLVDDVVSMIRPQADVKNLRLLNASSDVEIKIESDIDKCRHILQNLIGNSVKFTAEGRVEITVKQLDNSINFVVSDTGVGISEAHHAHIFDEFRQADGSTSRRFGGTGLGLAIAKKYANLLGGTITVKSSLGKGAEFTLSLPLNYDLKNKITHTKTYNDFKTENKQIQAIVTTDDSKKTILLVDDSEPAIIQLKDILSENSYEILVANTGAEALKIIEHTIPDAMILDLMMPGIDGFKVLETIRNAEPTAAIPVLILTAKQITKDDLQFLKRNNIHQLIQKGDVNREELLGAVAGMVVSQAEELPKPERKIQEFEGKPTIIVVEDNADNMLTVKAILADSCVLLEAINGEESIEMAKKYRPNLILMDIALPEMDGIEAFNTIRNDPNLQHIPIIALTASAMTSDRETILKYGFDSYIAKPIDEHLFFKSINETLYGN